MNSQASSAVGQQQASDNASQTNPKHEASALWNDVISVRSIRKRDGRIQEFDRQKLYTSLEKAFADAGLTKDKKGIERTFESVLGRLIKKFNGIHVPGTDDVRETIAVTLIDQNYGYVAKQYLGSRVEARVRSDEPVYGKGIRFQRFYTQKGVHSYDKIQWERRHAQITNSKGEIVFEQKDVETPIFYSQTATNILVSKYFRGRLGTPERETSVRQMVDRVAQTITRFGKLGGYFLTEEDAVNFEDELTDILVNQRAAFNSPVWFNVGVSPKPQCSACFINSVHDDMRSILNLTVTEGMLFKYGSGAGSNLSKLRSSKEKLGGSSGHSSGPVSFMKGLDAFAGVIRSGGKTRRAAKMVILDVEHPDIGKFIWCKAKEEKKAHTLIDAGYDGSIDGEAYASIFYQNANNSVRVTDAFMEAVEKDGDFWTKYVLDGDPCERFKARELMKQIAQAAWECGDPGIQYDTTINNWHTCSASDRIYASNPCSEYMFLDDTACNLSSVNLMRCRNTDGSFNIEAYKHVCKTMITAQEIVVDFSSYPTPSIEQNSWDYRTLGLGYANLGALLMSRGIPYDSEEGRNLAAALTSILSGTAYEQSAKIAEKIGPFRWYKKNEESMLNVIRKHRDTSRAISSDGVPMDVLNEARASWERALAEGELHGFRNAQISVLAPTGTIGFLMDCQTTGIEPPIALVSYKWLVGGGMLKLVNETVPEALYALGYRESEIKEIIDYIDANDTIEGAPNLKASDLPVFDCAFKAARGTRSITPMGHINMMAAVQPFLSGAISKTVNMSTEATVEDIMDVYMKGWKLGLKAIAIYRDGCKRAQPLTTSKEEKKTEMPTVTSPTPIETPAVIAPIFKEAVTETGEVFAPRRRRLPDERKAVTHKFRIAAHEGFITVGLYDDGTPGEIFITMSKEGSTLSGLLDSFATSVSIGLQYGVPLKKLVHNFVHVRYEPSGFTNNPSIRMAKSITDYIFRWLAIKFLPSEDRQALGLKVDESPLTASSIEVTDTVVSETSEDEKQQSLLDIQYGSAGSDKMTAMIDNQSDAPICDTCGSIMVRNGACYKCLNCGNTSGCS